MDGMAGENGREHRFSRSLVATAGRSTRPRLVTSSSSTLGAHDVLRRTGGCRVGIDAASPSLLRTGLWSHPEPRTTSRDTAHCPPSLVAPRTTRYSDVGSVGC